MFEARSRDDWEHTGAMLAMTANVNRDPRKGKAFTPDDFNPWKIGQSSGSRGVRLTTDNLHSLKKIFVEDK